MPSVAMHLLQTLPAEPNTTQSAEQRLSAHNKMKFTVVIGRYRRPGRWLNQDEQWLLFDAHNRGSTQPRYKLLPSPGQSNPEILSAMA